MEKKKAKIEIEHWNCAGCNRELTIAKGDEIAHHIHFDISRSNKQLFISGEYIEEDLTERNEKMLYTFCEMCFINILNESKTLGKHFYDKERDMFIY